MGCTYRGAVLGQWPTRGALQCLPHFPFTHIHIQMVQHQQWWGGPQGHWRARKLWLAHYYSANQGQVIEKQPGYYLSLSCCRYLWPIDDTFHSWNLKHLVLCSRQKTFLNLKTANPFVWSFFSKFWTCIVYELWLFSAAKLGVCKNTQLKSLQLQTGVGSAPHRSRAFKQTKHPTLNMCVWVCVYMIHTSSYTGLKMFQTLSLTHTHTRCLFLGADLPKFCASRKVQLRERVCLFARPDVCSRVCVNV